MKRNPETGDSPSVVTHPDGDTLVICPGGEFYDELGSGPLLGVVERAEPADDPDAVLAGRRLLLLGHGAGWGERCWWSTGRR